LNSESEEINGLLKKAAENAGKDRLQQAAQNMFRARSIAKKTQDKSARFSTTSQVFARKLITLTSLSAETGSCSVTVLLNRQVDSVLK